MNPSCGSLVRSHDLNSLNCHLISKTSQPFDARCSCCNHTWLSIARYRSDRSVGSRGHRRFNASDKTMCTVTPCKFSNLATLMQVIMAIHPVTPGSKGKE